jgi:phenylacetate-CoA ligase
MNQLYLSAYHLVPEFAPFYLDALEKHKIRYMLGNTQPIYSLAAAGSDLGRSVRMEVVVTNAEPLYEHQRKMISRAFCCPVRETYGMAEYAAAASECGSGILHVWPDVGIIEVLDWESDRPATPGTIGRIVATSLLDADTPLIRYEVGDVGAVSPGEGRCKCGRLLPRLMQLEGRIEDVFIARDGSRVGNLGPVFTASMRIREAQLVQVSFDRVVVRVVPLPGYSKADESLIAARLQERMGAVTTCFEILSSIPRERNGKFRAVVCKLSVEEKRKLRDGRA